MYLHVSPQRIFDCLMIRVLPIMKGAWHRLPHNKPEVAREVCHEFTGGRAIRPKLYVPPDILRSVQEILHVCFVPRRPSRGISSVVAVIIHV